MSGKLSVSTTPPTSNGKSAFEQFGDYSLVSFSAPKGDYPEVCIRFSCNVTSRTEIRHRYKIEVAVSTPTQGSNSKIKTSEVVGTGSKHDQTCANKQ